MGAPMQDSRQDSRAEPTRADEQPWVFDQRPGDGGGTGGRTAWVVLPLVAILLATGGYGAHLLLEEIPDPPATGQEAAPVTCWDGVVGPAEDCTVPSGRKGLRWVFPSFRPAEQDCRNLVAENPDATRPAMFECTERLEGREVHLVYSEVRGLEQATQYLGRRYDQEPREIDTDDGGTGWLRWTGRRPRLDGTHRLEQMYADHPFSVEVRAETVRLRDRGITELVEMRPPGEVLVRPVED